MMIRLVRPNVSPEDSCDINDIIGDVEDDIDDDIHDDIIYNTYQFDFGYTYYTMMVYLL